MLIDVTATPFPTLARERLFEPLGMHNSSYEQAFAYTRPGATAVGHFMNGRPLKCQWRVFPAMAAAGLWTTPSDLAHLLLEVQRAHTGKPTRVPKKATADQLLTPQAHAPGYGLGFA
jgi:CubicO group peptidase (beta-lactamase class C family)